MEPRLSEYHPGLEQLDIVHEDDEAHAEGVLSGVAEEQHSSNVVDWRPPEVLGEDLLELIRTIHGGVLDEEHHLRSLLKLTDASRDDFG